MSMSDYFKGLEQERKQRKLNNMQKIIPYLQSLYSVKKEEEAAELMKAQKEAERQEWQDKEDYKLNNQIFLKNVDSNNRWNEDNLKRQADFQNDVSLENLKSYNNKSEKLFGSNLDKHDSTKSNSKSDSNYNSKTHTGNKALNDQIERADYLVKNAEIVKETDDNGNEVSWIKIGGVKHAPDSPIGKEFQKAKADLPFLKRKKAVDNNSLEDLVEQSNEYKPKFNVRQLEKKGDRYYYKGKKYKGNYQVFDDEMNKYSNALKAHNELTGLYNFEIQPGKYANFNDLWETQKEYLLKQYPDLTELELKKRMFKELSKSKKTFRDKRS